MKKARLKKVLIILIVAIAILLSLSIRGYAATQMMDEAIVSNYNALGTEAGIYQTAINSYMDTSKSLATEIANARIYYGQGETLKVRFSFSRDVANVSNLRLGLRFGNGTERVITNPEPKGSYVIFSYNIASDDFGGLTLTFVDGTVTDTSGNTIAIGILGMQNTWTNQIIAKGAWNGPGILSESIVFWSDFDVNDQEDEDRKTYGGAYILDVDRIRKMTESDVKIVNTSDGSVSSGTPDTIEITYDGNAVTNVRPKNSSDIIFIENICDIAGNWRDNTSNKGSHFWRLISCTGNLHDGTYYCKAGTKVRFLVMGSTTSTIEVGGSRRNLTNTSVIANAPSNIYIYEYTIQNGDNGQITAYSDDNYIFNAIADTTAPRLVFDGIYLMSGTAYYSETAGATDPWNSTLMETGSAHTVTGGSIWAKKNAEFYVKWRYEDSYGWSKSSYGNQNGSLKRIDSGGWRNNTESWAHLKADYTGLCNFYKTAMDYAGNETLDTYVRDSITLLSDCTGPKINFSFEDDYNINGNTYIDSRYATVFINPSDPKIGDYRGSGVELDGDYNYVDVSDVTVTNGSIAGYWYDNDQLELKIIPNGDGYVSLYVPYGATTDILGNPNQTSEVKRIYFDTKAPVINDVTGVPTDWTREATLSVIASDEGVGGIQYSFDNGNTYSDSNVCTVTSNGIVQIKVRDSFGNVSQEKIVNITKIDNVAPTIQGIEQKQLSRYSTEVTIKANDAHSGLAEYSFDGGASWQTSPTKIYTESTTIQNNQLKVKDRVGNIGTYNGTVSVIVNGLAPIIKLENNGGNFVIPVGKNVSTVHPKIEVDTENNCTIYYAISQSNTTEPSKYDNVVSNKAELNIDLPEGTWYLWTYAIDNSLNLSSIKYVSEAFIVSSAVVFDTTTDGTCIEKVEIINGTNYVIVPIETTVSDLLKYIKSPYNVTIRRLDSDKELAGDSKLVTNEIINVDEVNQQYKIVVKGDVTGNGKVGLSDITKLNQYRLNKTVLNDAEFLAGDVTEDGKIGLGDITKLNQYRLNKIEEL